MAKKKIQDFKIVDVISLNRDHFLLKLQSEEQLQELLPGQFAQVKIEQSSSTFLRRPFSIHDVNYANQIITLFIKIAGKGTQKLSESRPGEIINMVYPLGNSFTIPDSGKVLLTGGGCGVAPLLFLAKTL